MNRSGIAHARPRAQKVAAAACLVALLGMLMPSPAAAENNGAATTPFMGWSTWNFIGHNPTQANVEAQAQALANQLSPYGYNYVLVDDFWYLNPSTTVDANGRWVVDSSEFPNGIAAVANYVHSLGLKFGMYVTPGIPVAAVNQNTPIAGTSCHAQDIANTSQYENNYNFGNVMYYINYSNPCAQAFINSWANQLASWGVDFLKLDGVGDQDTGDVEAWSSALQSTGRVILFDLSNSLDPNNGGLWRQYSNAWRIDNDVECYGSCPGLVSWNNIYQRSIDAPKFAQFAGPGGWNDLDAMSISNGAVDGLTNNERQTYMTLWAIESAPLYLGDDLTQLDSYGLSLLRNTAVIAIDQSGNVAKPINQSSNQQVWFADNSDGSRTVALFNFGNASEAVTANWSDLGLSGTAAVNDVWSGSGVGTYSGSFNTSLPAHGSRLLKIATASSCTPTAITPYVVVSGQGWQQTTSASVSSGSSVSLGPQPINGGSWNWTGPNGFTSTAREIDSIPLVPGVNTFTATYTNPSGCSSAEVFTITVNGFSGTYELQNAFSGLALNVSGASTTNGAEIIQWPFNGSPNSLWTFVPTSNGYYQIVNVNSGLDVVVYGASTASGAGLIQYSFGSSGDDQWMPVQNSDGSYTFYNRNSGQAIDDPGLSLNNATQMIQWPADGGTNQHWYLISQ